MKAKAIETNYRGMHFRSRLEARWAIAFDSLKIPFEYEFEGFELPSGRYLPDFDIGPGKLYFEVKGEPPTMNEIRLGCELAEMHRTTVLIAYSGFNWDEGTRVYSPRICACWGMTLEMEGVGPSEPMFDTGLALCWCAECGKFTASISTQRMYCRLHAERKCTGKHDLQVEDCMQSAYRAAVGARFEFEDRK